MDREWDIHEWYLALIAGIYCFSHRFMVLLSIAFSLASIACEIIVVLASFAVTIVWL